MFLAIRLGFPVALKGVGRSDLIRLGALADFFLKLLAPEKGIANVLVSFGGPFGRSPRD